MYEVYSNKHPLTKNSVRGRLRKLKNFEQERMMYVSSRGHFSIKCGRLAIRGLVELMSNKAETIFGVDREKQRRKLHDA